MDEPTVQYPLTAGQILQISEMVALHRTALAQPEKAEKLNARIARIQAECSPETTTAFEAVKKELELNPA